MEASRPLLVAVVAWTIVSTSGLSASDLLVQPARVTLDRPESSQQMLVGETLTGGRVRDLTRDAAFTVRPLGIAIVDRLGVLRPLANGRADLEIEHAGRSSTVSIEVTGLERPPAVSFRNEVVPIFTKAKCNSGGCHGKAEGQNGFRLSIFGYDPASDFGALVMESRGRRVSPASPERSLLLLKATSLRPHGGGRKLKAGGYRDQRLTRWIREGASFDSSESEEARIVRIEVRPKQRILFAGQDQQLQVTAIDMVGRRVDVTTETVYESNASSIADVDSRGLVTASDTPGEAAILVRFLGHVAVCRVTSPHPEVSFARPQENNFVDRFVWDKLQRLGIEASGQTDDASFVRRVFLDTIGTLPSTGEVVDFLADERNDKRERLIEKLLERDEYVDYWTMKWLDILRADQLKISPQGTVAMQRWLRRGFAENRPFDQLARELLTVQGNTSSEGPGSFYKVLSKPEEAAHAISQLLLGVRIECAQCHHHPSEKWSQGDFVGLAGFFTGVTLKKLPNGEQAIVSRGGKDLPHPRDGALVPARALGAESADFSGVSDRRRVLADWVASAENPYFSKAIANRLWAHYFGRGLIEPIDDIRQTNPATNEPLMQALGEHMVELKFDLKAYTRTLLNSRVYQLSAQATISNVRDQQSFSHAAYKTLPAEVLLDVIGQSTGVGEKFNGWPEGYRAIQVWDNRMPSYFFRIFGRPARASVCECERSNQPSIAQALHLLNSPEIASKIEHRNGRARQLANSALSPSEIIDQLFLSTLSRHPVEREHKLMMEAFASHGVDRRSAAEDILWALMNSKEFVFNH